jgi:hypothetical protein
VIWGDVANCSNTCIVPDNITQCCNWLDNDATDLKNIHIINVAAICYDVAAICWAVWKARNKMCFERILINSPKDSICHACALLNVWACLRKKELLDLIREGAQLLVRARAGADLDPGPPGRGPGHNLKVLLYIGFSANKYCLKYISV